MIKEKEKDWNDEIKEKKERKKESKKRQTNLR